MNRVVCLVCIFASLAVVPLIPAPPVDPVPGKTEDQNKTDNALGLEYERYLKEIVSVLEQDEEFRNKVQNTPADQLKSGLIANELQFVNHNVRTQLDEVKRRELWRLRQLAMQQMDINNGRERPRLRLPSHIDHLNPASFEVQDLAMLIRQANKDLEEADRQRKEEYKRYEMEKEHVRREKLKQLDEKRREEEQKHFEEMQAKHKKHPQLHHPGSKQQLEEVWEESDGLEKRDFEPKTFFKLHDLNQDGYLDTEELEALFQKELDKVYDPNAPEDDMIERNEEMSRMREHVMLQVDTNKDALISWEEFLAETNKREFEQDEGWKTLDEQQQVYNEKELEEYERQRNREELMRIQHGAARAQAGYPIHPNQIPQQAFQPLPHQAFQQYPQPGMGQNLPHPGFQQYPQGAYQQFPGQGIPQQGFQQYPQQGFQQLPQQGYQQFQPQVPVQYQQAPQQVPIQSQQALPQAGPQSHQVPQSAPYQSQQAAHVPIKSQQVLQQVPIQSQQVPQQVPVQSQQMPQQVPIESQQVQQQVSIQSQQVPVHSDQVPIQPQQKFRENPMDSIQILQQNPNQLKQAPHLPDPVQNNESTQSPVINSEQRNEINSQQEQKNNL